MEFMDAYRFSLTYSLVNNQIFIEVLYILFTSKQVIAIDLDLVVSVLM